MVFAGREYSLREPQFDFALSFVRLGSWFGAFGIWCSIFSLAMPSLFLNPEEKRAHVTLSAVLQKTEGFRRVPSGLAGLPHQLGGP